MFDDADWVACQGQSFIQSEFLGCFEHFRSLIDQSFDFLVSQGLLRIVIIWEEEIKIEIHKLENFHQKLTHLNQAIQVTSWC